MVLSELTSAWYLNRVISSLSRLFFSSTNEKLDRSNFIEGTKLLGTYLHEVAAANA
jgi:hypothetical protein